MANGSENYVKDLISMYKKTNETISDDERATICGLLMKESSMADMCDVVTQGDLLEDFVCSIMGYMVSCDESPSKKKSKLESLEESMKNMIAEYFKERINTLFSESEGHDINCLDERSDRAYQKFIDNKLQVFTRSDSYEFNNGTRAA